ncbi:MAG TPA: hypothetical protein VEY31_00825 [Roseococcus sp.]|nr:hypothetical protein [Roseococcus sp.]
MERLSMDQYPNAQSKEDSLPGPLRVQRMPNGWLRLDESRDGPAGVDIVLIQPGRGVALLEFTPAWAPGAVDRLRGFLDQAGFTAAHSGHLPIIHRKLRHEDEPDLGSLLEDAFDWQEPISLSGRGAWEAELVGLLAVPKALAAEAPRGPNRRVLHVPPADLAPIVLAPSADAPPPARSSDPQPASPAASDHEVFTPTSLVEECPAAPDTRAELRPAAEPAHPPAAADAIAVTRLPPAKVARAASARAARPMPPQDPDLASRVPSRGLGLLALSLLGMLGAAVGGLVFALRNEPAAFREAALAPAMPAPAAAAPMAAPAMAVPAFRPLAVGSLPDSEASTPPLTLAPLDRILMVEAPSAQAFLLPDDAPVPALPSQPEPPASVPAAPVPLAAAPPPGVVIALPAEVEPASPAPPEPSVAFAEPPPVMLPFTEIPAPPDRAEAAPAGTPPADEPTSRAETPAAPYAASPTETVAAPALILPPAASVDAPVAPIPAEPALRDTSEPFRPEPAVAMQAPPPASAPPPQPVPPLVAAPVATAPPPVPNLPTEPPPILAAMLRRGEALLATGDISGARRFFERGAAMGSAAAARALAETFDPATLASRNTRGLQPDPAQALQWYRRAEELGATELAPRIARLEATR